MMPPRPAALACHAGRHGVSQEARGRSLHLTKCVRSLAVATFTHTKTRSHQTCSLYSFLPHSLFASPPPTEPDPDPRSPIPPAAATYWYGRPQYPLVRWGQHYMKDRTALDLRLPLALWNAALAALSGYGAWKIAAYVASERSSGRSLDSFVCDHARTYTAVDAAWVRREGGRRARGRRARGGG